MKVGNLIPEELMKSIVEEEGICDVCHLHRTADEVIPNLISCPYCKGTMNLYELTACDADADSEDNIYVVVGESNTYDVEENIKKYITGMYTHGSRYISLIPTKVIYNGNHDIHYTGGTKYLTKDMEGLSSILLPSIKQYSDRIRARESLALWLSRDIESAVAKYLYDLGFKK